MRNFMKIVESMSDDTALNAQIEAKLAEAVPSSDDRTKVLDGMTIIHDSYTKGVNTGQWIKAMKTMWPTANGEEMKRVAHLMMGLFGKNGMGLIHTSTSEYGTVWHWQDPMPERVKTSPYTDVDMTDPMAQMARTQIQYTAMVHELMRASGTFTPDEIAHRLAAGTGMPPQFADQFVDHCITMSQASVKPVGNGSYRWADAPVKSGLSFLRDLEGYEPPKPDVK